MPDAAATFSVIICHYNDSRFLADALAGVLEQEDPPDQVIVVDDGSDQAERAGFDAIVARYPRLEVVRHPANRGVVAAGLTGLERATGDYVAWWSVDDKVEPGILSAARAAAARFPGAGVIATETDVVTEVNARRVPAYSYRFGTDRAGTFVSGREFAALNGRRYIWMSATGAFVRRDVLRSGLGWCEEFGLFADWIALYATAIRYGAVLIGRPMSTVLCRADSAGKLFRADEAAQTAALRAFLDSLREPESADVRAAFSRGPLAVSHAFGWLLFRAAWNRPGDWDLLVSAGVRHLQLRLRIIAGREDPMTIAGG